MRIPTPRAIWKGSLTIGLVNVPVKIGSCVKEDRVSYNRVYVHKNGTIERPRQTYLLEDGTEVSTTDLVSGFPAGEGYIVVTQEEREAVAAVQDRCISIEGFVPQVEVDPIHYAKPYFLFPDDRGDKGYALMCKAMKRRKVIAIARYLMRTKQYMVAVRPVGNTLIMQHLYWATELTDPAPWDAGLGEIPTRPAEVNQALSVVDAFTISFDSARYTDETKEKTRELIEAKMKGKGIKLAKPQPPVPSVDVLGDIERTLAVKAQEEAGTPAPSSPRAKAAAKKATTAKRRAKT